MESAQHSTTIVVVPGAHHTVEHLQQVSDIVKKDGYAFQVVRPIQPGDGFTPEGMEGSLKRIHQVVKEVIDKGHDVLLVVHSASGTTGPAAIEGLIKTDEKPGVKHILAIAGILTHPGQSMVDVIKGRTAQWQSFEDGHAVVFPFDHPGEAPTTIGRFPVSPVTALYNDMTEAQKRHAYDLLVPMYASDFMEKVHYSAWQHIPTTYVITDKDLALFPELQQEYVDQAGVDFDVRHWNSSHTPFVSMPDTVAKLMEELADKPFKL